MKKLGWPSWREKMVEHILAFGERPGNAGPNTSKCIRMLAVCSGRDRGEDFRARLSRNVEPKNGAVRVGDIIARAVGAKDRSPEMFLQQIAAGIEAVRSSAGPENEPGKRQARRPEAGGERRIFWHTRVAKGRRPGAVALTPPATTVPPVLEMVALRTPAEEDAIGHARCRLAGSPVGRETECRTGSGRHRRRSAWAAWVEVKRLGRSQYSRLDRGYWRAIVPAKIAGRRFSETELDAAGRPAGETPALAAQAEMPFEIRGGARKLTTPATASEPIDRRRTAVDHVRRAR